MFNQNLYCEACLELKAPQEKIEEVLTMTEHSKHKIRRPARLLAVAAAVTALLVISVSAANGGFLEGIVGTIRSSISIGDYREELVMENGVEITALRFPEVSVEEKQGKIILLVDGEQTDITNAMAQDGRYIWDFEDEGTKIRVEVFRGEDGTLQTSTSVMPAEETDPNAGVSLIGECTEG